MHVIKIKNTEIGNDKLTVISGPCVIEDEDFTFNYAKKLKKLFSNFDINFIFKASFDKANRSSVHSFRGPGITKGLQILKRIKEELDLVVLSDIHTPDQADIVKDVLDIIQIPALLCRQTDLLLAAGRTQKPVNIKKGQFMSPWDMKNTIEKILSTNNKNIILTDRGTSFGYNNLMTDFRAIPVMQSFGYPVCFDATHSVQLPGGLNTISGGQREFILPLAKASIAIGANVLFLESHPNPAQAKSDAACVLPFNDMEKLLTQITKIHEANKQECLC